MVKKLFLYLGTKAKVRCTKNVIRILEKFGSHLNCRLEFCSHCRIIESFAWYFLTSTLTSLIKGQARLFFSRKKSSLPSDFHVID